MVKRLVIGFLTLVLAACSSTMPQIQSVPALNLEVNPSLLDPALQGQDREDMETILRLLPTALREDVSFIDMESDKAYDSLLQARGLSYSAKSRVKVKWFRATRASRDPPTRLEWRGIF